MPNPLTEALARVRLRNQPGPLRFALAERIDFLNAAHWDDVTQGRGFLLSRRYLQTLERVRPDNLDPSYALLYRDGEPVAAVVMQWIDVDGSRLRKSNAPSRLGAAAAKVKQKLAEHVSARVLVIGNLLSYGNHGVAIRAGLEADDAVWHAVGEAAYRIRRAEKHVGSTDFVLLKDLRAAEMSDSRRLHDLGYRPVETEPNMVLALDAKWRSHDDYLAALSSKYRKNIRARTLKPIDEAGLTMTTATDLAPIAARLQQLYLSVHENASIRPITLSADYWPALAAAAGERARFSLLHRQDQLLGFVVSLLDTDDTAIGYHIGFDRDAATTLPLYLRLLQQTIADGIALGARRVSLGRTALEPKAALGARPEPLNVWVRHRQPVLNKLMRSLLGTIHHDDAPERSPFAQVADAREPS